MVDRNLEQRISKAVSHATPDVLDRILTSCDEQKGIGINMNNRIENNVNKSIRRNKWFTPVIAAAALLLLIGAGGFGINTWKVQHTVNSIVMLDVNPSISLKVNSNEKVLSVEPHNDDGKKILGDMDLQNTDLDAAVTALVGSMLKNGYLSDIQNAILVSVENNNQVKGSELQEKIARIIDTKLEDNQLEPEVLSQTVRANSTIKELAKKYNISVGKASFIQAVIKKDPTLTFDTLAPLPVHQIELIAHSKSINLENITKTGEASVKAYISKEKAKVIAYDHAKASKNTAKNTKIEFNSEDGSMVYELKFMVGNIEYKYAINAATGEIVNFTKDDDKDQSNQIDQDDDQDADQVKDDQNKVNQDKDDQGENEDGDDQDDNKADAHALTVKPAPSNTTYISKIKIKGIAFAHAKVKDSQVTGFGSKFGKKDKKAVYDITFKTANGKYEYVIDAASGKVITYEYKPTKSNNASSNSQNGNNQNNNNQGKNNQDKNHQGENNQDDDDNDGNNQDEDD